MRAFFFLFLLVFSSPLFSRPQPLTQAQKNWVDSINTIYGKKNPWFDSLMQADGKCAFIPGPEHWMQHDSSPDTWHFERRLYPEDIPAPIDAPLYVSFDYYPAAQKIITADGPEIYLRADGPVIIEFMYGMWGGRSGPQLIRKANDTIFYALYGHRDTVLQGLADTSRKLLLLDRMKSSTTIMTIVAGEQKKELADEYGNRLHLVECSFISADYPALAETYPLFRKPFMVVANDSLFRKLAAGDTVFVRADLVWKRDELRKIDFSYCQLVQVYPFQRNRVERLMVYSSELYVIHLLPEQASNREKRMYRRFVKRNPARNDPKGIYHDPVLRWLYREERFTKMPEKQ